MDRKEKRPPRITSAVFNRYGTEILASYSSESLYLLDPKQTLSYEKSQKQLSQHRHDKQNRSSLNDNRDVSTQAEHRPTQFKRLRLRGDWSDTGRSIR
jgi:hypothetical protein